MRTCRFPLLSSLVAIVIVGITLQSAAAPELAPLDIQQATPDKPITLRDRLVVGLQARINFEVAFCDNLAEKVQTGQLPEQLVDETFFWARQRTQSPRNGHHYRPITYFIPAMRARADKLHISLDPPPAPSSASSSFVDSLIERTFFPFR